VGVSEGVRAVRGEEVGGSGGGGGRMGEGLGGGGGVIPKRFKVQVCVLNHCILLIVFCLGVGYVPDRMPLCHTYTREGVWGRLLEIIGLCWRI